MQAVPHCCARCEDTGQSSCARILVEDGTALSHEGCDWSKANAKRPGDRDVHFSEAVEYWKSHVIAIYRAILLENEGANGSAILAVKVFARQELREVRTFLPSLP